MTANLNLENLKRIAELKVQQQKQDLNSAIASRALIKRQLLLLCFRKRNDCCLSIQQMVKDGVN